VSPDPRRDRTDEPDQEPDQGLLDETSPLPPPGGETTTPSEGPDDPPNEGEIARDDAP
jgi:hypothetical protein